MSALEWRIDGKQTNIKWKWQLHCCSSPRTQRGLVVKTAEALALGQTGHSGAKPRPAGEDEAGDTHRRKPCRRSRQEWSVKVGGTGPAAFELLFTQPSHCYSCFPACTMHLPNRTASLLLLCTSTDICRHLVKYVNLSHRANDGWSKHSKIDIFLN